MSPLNVLYIPQSREEKELQFSAEMTQYQFEAIECKLEEPTVLTQLGNLDYLNNIQMSNSCDILDVEKWLKNSWNTERLLRFTRDSFTGNSLSFSIQWAFPQLYYSVFSSILAYYRVVGFTERSHSSVIRKFGMLTNEVKYPVAISFRAFGGKNNIIFTDTNLTPGYEAIRFVSTDPDSVNNQICQFLRSTRKIDLANKKSNIKIRNSKGTGNKSNFNHEDWENVSNKLGHTNLLSLLYRKRLKSNYRDIDTFLSEHLNATTLFNSIVNIANIFNLIHESYIIKAIGQTRYGEILNNIDYDFVLGRSIKINDMLP